MTPKEYLKLRDTIQAAIDTLEKAMYDAAELAEASPLPENLRPASADDIKVGALIWYKHGDEGPFWQVVQSPLHYGDSFKAYTAEDGCRYGLDDAWIEVDA